MNTEEKQSIREKFYKEFGQRMIIKNEISGNDYNPISDWWITILEEEIQKAYKDCKERAVEIAKSNTKGTFTDDGGNDCWYTDDLVSNLNNI